MRVTHADGVLTEVDAKTVDVERRVRLGGRLGALAASGDDVFVPVRESGASHRGGTLEMVGDKHGTDSADPAIAYTVITWQLALITGDGLVGYRRTGGTAGYELVPDLAERLPAVSDGGRTLAFRLRNGVRYSNGEPVRASDVRRGLERSFDLHSPVLQHFDAIAGASACTRRKGPCDLSKGIVVDDRARTLTIHLARRDPDILDKLTLSAAYAVPASAPRREVRAGLPATGPYRYARFDRKREVLLVRNPHFREWSAAAQPAGYPDRIHIRLGLSTDAQVAAIRDGRADLAGDNYIFTDALVRRLSVAYASRLRARPYNAHDWAFLDTRSRPFDDERARRAVNLAVDRSVFAGAINARPTCQVLPTNSIGYRSYCPSGIRGDLPRARRLVAQSGTRGARVRVWSPGDLATADARVGVVVTALKRLGYRTSVRRFENYAAYFMALAAGGRPHVGYFPWFADYQAPSGTVGPQLSCGGEVNYGGFCDRRIDALAARAAARQTDDPRAAYDLWAEVDRRLTDAAAVVPLTDGIDVASCPSGCATSTRAGWSQLWVR